MMPKITAVSRQPGYKLAIDFSDGTSGVIDFAPLIKRGGVYSRLRTPKSFEFFQLGRGGRSLDFSRACIDFCADALWLQLKNQKNPINPQPMISGHHQRPVGAINSTPGGLTSALRVTPPISLDMKEFMKKRSKKKAKHAVSKKVTYSPKKSRRQSKRRKRTS